MDELGKWLIETKDKKLSLEELDKYINYDTSYDIYVKLDGGSSEEKAEILFRKWNEHIEEFLFKKGDCYVVTKSNGYYNGDLNYCYQVYESTNKNTFYYMQGNSINTKEVNVRKATKEESDKYNEIGEPYDVSILNNVEKDWSKATKEELLEEVKRRYPIGTVFINAFNNPYNKDSIHTIKSTNLIWYTNGYYEIGEAIIDDDSTGLVYFKGNWAEIISLPEVKVEESIPEYVECIKAKESYFIVGNIYKVIDYHNLSSVEVVSNIKCESFEADSTLFVTLFEDGVKCYKPSTKEAFYAQGKVEEKPQFEVGKWYKGRENDKYIKFKDISSIGDYNRIYYSEKIEDGIYKSEENYWANNTLEEFALNNPVSLEEIQKYLPKGHPDKIEKIMKEEDTLKRLSFYVKYTEKFTEDLYNALLKWCEDKYPGKDYTFTNNTFSDFKKEEFFWVEGREKSNFGVDNNSQGRREKYTIQQIKDLIGYKKLDKSLTINDLVVGKYYKIWENGKFCLILNAGRSDPDRIRGYYISNMNADGNIFIFKNDTPWITGRKVEEANTEDIKWLNICIKQNKFIELSELDKYDDNGNLITVPIKANLNNLITRAVRSNNPNLIAEELGCTIQDIIDDENSEDFSCIANNFNKFRIINDKVSCVGLDCLKDNCPFKDSIKEAKDWLLSKSNKPINKTPYKLGDYIVGVQYGGNNITHKRWQKSYEPKDIMYIIDFDKESHENRIVAITDKGHVLYIESYPEYFRLATPEEISDYLLKSKYSVSEINTSPNGKDVPKKELILNIDKDYFPKISISNIKTISLLNIN